MASYTGADDLTLGTASSYTGTAKFVGTTSGVVTVKAADAAGTWTFKWPTTAGSAGNPLFTDGTGVTDWATNLTYSSSGASLVVGGTTALTPNTVGAVGVKTANSATNRKCYVFEGDGNAGFSLERWTDNFGAKAVTLFTINNSITTDTFSFGNVGTIDASGAVLLSKDQRVTKTGNYPVLSSDTGTQFDNIGASGAVTFTLPTPSKGLRYGFYVDAAQTVTLAPANNTTQTIRIAGSVTNTGGTGAVSANTVGNYIEITAISTTQWVAKSHEGTWTVT